MFISLFFQSGPPIDHLDALARARDVTALTQYLADPGVITEGGKNPFALLKTGGGYAMGQMGWHARLLEPRDGTARYVVFSTPIIVEDAGELLFRIDKGGKLVYIPEQDDLGMQLHDHNFAVWFDLPAHRVKVFDNFSCGWTGKEHPHFLFRMTPTLQVSSVTTVDSKPVQWAQAGGVVAISAPKVNRFMVTYSGDLVKPGFAKQIGPDEATLSGSMWYPMIARHPTTYSIVIHAPVNWLALAQGRLRETKVEGNERVTLFEMDRPVCWFSATAGPYRQVTTRINGIDFSTISASASDDAMRRQNENNAEVIDFYSKTFGKYPFDRWTTVDSTQFQEGVGALEAYSFATYPAGGVPFLDTHEPAHTWWGGIINNDYLQSIWNESFADYSQVMFNVDQPVGNREERHRAYFPHNGYSPDFDAAPMARSGQDIGPPATALGYAKGAYVLQVLEDELSADTFIQCLQEWIRSNPLGHIGAWEDFEHVVDRVAGRDLTWFFDEWVRGKGLPNFSLVDGAWDDEHSRFSGKVAFQGPAYRLDLDAVLEYPSGGRSYTRVSIDPSTGGRFTIVSKERPVVVALDPFYKIARRHAPSYVPVTLSGFSRSQVIVDPATPSWLRPVTGGAGELRPIGDSFDLDGVFLVGPATTPVIRTLGRSVGITVEGDQLTWEGTTIDLRDGGALAVVDLPGGKHCMIGLGTCSRAPLTGHARLMLFDGKGRMLRALTDPIDQGPLSVRL